MTRDMKNPVAATLQTILGEADDLIRRRLKEIGFEVPHVVVAVTPEGEVILRSNVSAEVLRSFGEDLTNLADDLTATPKLGGHVTLMTPAVGWACSASSLDQLKAQARPDFRCPFGGLPRRDLNMVRSSTKASKSVA